jgi:large subunit ribosomal protein L19
MEPLLQYVQDEFVSKKELPSFQAGDTITVYYEIREGSKVRTQFFKGVVIQIKGSGATKTFTIRKMSGTVGVERPWYSENRGKCTWKSTPVTYFLFP